MQQRGALAVALGLAVLVPTWAALAATRAWPTALGQHLLYCVLAGGAWTAAVLLVPRLPASRAQLGIIVVVALALRVPAWLSPPVHSDDVHRYLWDGRVTRAGINPYGHAPDAPELQRLRDDEWQRINNRDLPTIYPPLAQLAFAISPSLWVWKIVVALADAAVALILFLWLAAAQRDRRLVVTWAWSPLVTMELALNAHVDALGIGLLVGGLLAWERGRRALAGGLVAAATLVKLLPVVVLTAMRDRRALVTAMLVVLALALPFSGAGTKMLGSLGEYSRRWRINDGAFAVLHAAATKIVTHTRFARRYEMADSPRLARLVTGRDRDEVYPDEIANLLARIVSGLVFVTLVAWALHQRAPPAKLAEVAIGAFVLLTPALHPWYVLWLLPLVAAGGSRAWLVLATLVPLGYRPLDGWLMRGTWHDPTWTRVLEHGATLLVLAIDRVQTSGIIFKFGRESSRRV
jgi:hypothetical protein